VIKIILGITVIAMIFTLGYSQDVFAQEEAMVDEISPLGSDRDEFGCIPSAGYSWSEEKQECVRPFEEEAMAEEWVISEIPPLRFQIEFYYPSEEITCRDDLVKMYKNNGESICVKETSVQKLTERNIASEDESSVVPSRMGSSGTPNVCKNKPNKSWAGAAYGYCLTKQQRDQLKGMFGQCLSDNAIGFTWAIMSSVFKGGVGFIGPLADCSQKALDQMGLRH